MNDPSKLPAGYVLYHDLDSPGLSADEIAQWSAIRKEAGLSEAVLIVAMPTGETVDGMAAPVEVFDYAVWSVHDNGSGTDVATEIPTS